MLSKTYWASDRTKETVEKSIKNSISFVCITRINKLVLQGVVTDKAVFLWLLDVVIDENYRRNGLGQWFGMI